jgi:hypothetical protein
MISKCENVLPWKEREIKKYILSIDQDYKKRPLKIR